MFLSFHKNNRKRKSRLSVKVLLVCFILLTSVNTEISAQKNTPLRRPTSTTSPMWIIHIDTWNAADPASIIELVPEDIRPYVVFNVSLSVSDFVIKKYPFSICESWVRTCAEKGVWVMIQPASGYLCNMPYAYADEYEYFYKTYPNFIGWNFAEQNWGFPSDVAFSKRLDLFVELLKLADEYGGYLSVSNFMGVGNYTNPIGQLKNHPTFEQACKTYSRNYILQDKFTFPSGFYDNESAHLGVFLSGYAGHYGVRFDECGWKGNNPFAESSGIAAVLEHFLLTGATITDGPETIPMQATHQISNGVNSLGFTYKRWEMYPQMIDLHVDIFRKILNGSFRIPTKQEVIDRTKVAFINDIKQGTNIDKYSTSPSLFTGLYAMDAELGDNRTWFKKTGRYPSIPMMHKEDPDVLSQFAVYVKKSEYAQKWGSLSTKTSIFNALFPSEYVGDSYVARIKNTWLTYNPYKEEYIKSHASIPLQYNTCDTLKLSFDRFSVGVINELADKLQIYLNNYCTNPQYGIREDIITINGCLTEPTFTVVDRGRVASTVQKTWSNGTLILSIRHNGPVDIEVQCNGSSTNKRSDYPEAVTMVKPLAPPIYTGPRQYEGENFTFRNVASVDQTSLKNYTAMGYITFATNDSRIMDSITVLQDGFYNVHVRYQAPTSNIYGINVIVNGKRVDRPIFRKTVADDRAWSIYPMNIYLKKGVNVIEFSSTQTINSFYIDNIVVSKNTYDFTHDQTANETGLPAPNYMSMLSGCVGVVDYSDNELSDKGLSPFYVNDSIVTSVANLDLFANTATNYAVVWKEHLSQSRAEKGLLLRANGTCPFTAGMKMGYLCTTHVNENNYLVLQIYLANEAGLNLKSCYTTPFTVTNDTSFWVKAVANGQTLSVSYSIDNKTWNGGMETQFTDPSYKVGGVQLIGQINGIKDGWILDDITLLATSIHTFPSILTELNYPSESGPSASQSFILSAQDVIDDALTIEAPDAFEISTLPTSGFGTSLTFTKNVDGLIPSTLVYVRLKAGLGSGVYVDSLTIKSDNTKGINYVVSGEVENKPLRKQYDFEAEIAGTFATTPPARNVVVGQGNTATAGVISFTDATNKTSKVFKPYSGGQRESTGVFNLNLFSKKATNYSVTWKQLLASQTDNYKIGVLLRGDVNNVGNGTTGYVQGMMHGYAFVAYTNRGSAKTEFRIYKSTAGYALETYANVSANLNPAVGQPIWFRASVSGNTLVYLTFEYSLNGTNWITVSKYTDEESSYLNGATQFVWGLGAGSVNYVIDDIVYEGVALDEGIVSSIQKPPYSVELRYKQYYTVLGQALRETEIASYNGVYLVVYHYSDGSIRTEKCLTTKR